MRNLSHGRRDRIVHDQLVVIGIQRQLVRIEGTFGLSHRSHQFLRQQAGIENVAAVNAMLFKTRRRSSLVEISIPPAGLNWPLRCTITNLPLADTVSPSLGSNDRVGGVRYLVIV